MVNSLRVGGVIFESTPFSKEPVMNGKEDLRVHIHADIPMVEAMGPSMKFFKLIENGRRLPRIEICFSGGKGMSILI